MHHLDRLRQEVISAATNSTTQIAEDAGTDTGSNSKYQQGMDSFSSFAILLEDFVNLVFASKVLSTLEAMFLAFLFGVQGGVIACILLVTSFDELFVWLCKNVRAGRVTVQNNLDLAIAG